MHVFIDIIHLRYQTFIDIKHLERLCMYPIQTKKKGGPNTGNQLVPPEQNETGCKGRFCMPSALPNSRSNDCTAKRRQSYPKSPRCPFFFLAHAPADKAAKAATLHTSNQSWSKKGFLVMFVVPCLCPVQMFWSVVIVFSLWLYNSCFLLVFLTL